LYRWQSNTLLNACCAGFFGFLGLLGGWLLWLLRQSLRQPPVLGLGAGPAHGFCRLMAEGLCFGVAYQCCLGPFGRLQKR
jgi:hypothetical protein